MTIITWNIGLGQTNYWCTGKIEGIFESKKPDIFLFQEFPSEWAVKEFNSSYLKFFSRLDLDKSTASFVKKDFAKNFAFLGVSVFIPSYFNNETQEQKISQKAHQVLIFEKMNVFNVHLSADNRELRRQHLKQLGEFSANKDVSIYGGDFNENGNGLFWSIAQDPNDYKCHSPTENTYFGSDGNGIAVKDYFISNAKIKGPTILDLSTTGQTFHKPVLLEVEEVEEVEEEG